MTKRKIIVWVVVLAVILGAWIGLNPPGRFGLSMFGITTYGSIPRFVSDHQIRSDGVHRTVDKTHDLGLEDVQWLLDPLPEQLIIATGWRGVTKPSPAIINLDGCKVHILKTGEARKLYNKLKREGVSVAIHYHSTC